VSDLNGTFIMVKVLRTACQDRPGNRGHEVMKRMKMAGHYAHSLMLGENQLIQVDQSWVHTRSSVYEMQTRYPGMPNSQRSTRGVMLKLARFLFNASFLQKFSMAGEWLRCAAGSKCSPT
jgi:hypothetical protein